MNHGIRTFIYPVTDMARGPLILFGLFSLMSAIGFVTATPITAGAFVAWGPILLALAILLAVHFRSGERQSST